MKSVDHLNAMWRTHSIKIYPKVQSKHLAITASQIVDALNSEGVQANRRQSLKVDLATLDANKKHLRRN